MKTALIFGANGQDGRLTTEQLLARDYRVIGVGRQADCATPAHPNLEYVSLDLNDHNRVAQLLRRTAPDVAFHLAAIHGAAGFSYEAEFQALLAVNVTALQVLLEFARERHATGVLYASSSKIFGSSMPPLVNEETQAVPTCLYSISKNTAHQLIEYYRREHGVNATTLYLFNHESRYRPAQYFVPRLVAALAAVLEGKTAGYSLRSLDFRCNWGCAREYMGTAIDIMERDLYSDFVVAHETTWTGRDLCRELFAAHNLDYRDHVQTEHSGEINEPLWQPSTERLFDSLGRRPVRGILDVCDEILGAIRCR